jgi:hypothetical protein
MLLRTHEHERPRVALKYFEVSISIVVNGEDIDFILLVNNLKSELCFL